MSQRISRLAGSLLCLMLAILPFQQLWLHILTHYGVQGKLFLILTSWYEFLFWLLFMVAALLLLLGKTQWRLSKLDTFFLIWFVYALISPLWSHHSLGVSLVGWRFSILAVFTYFLARMANLDAKRLDPLLRKVFFGVLAIAGLQLVLWLFFSGAGWLDSLSFGIVDKVVKIPQLYASLGGPNQLASYLLLIIALTWSWKRYGAAALALFLLGLTFSRSAWLALAVMVLAYVFMERKWVILALFCAIGGVFALALVGVNSGFHGHLADLLTHGRSQTLHQTALQDAWQRFRAGSVWQMLFGYGAGTAGPATFVHGPVFIPESWYLQILYEYGVVGIALMLSGWLAALRSAYSQHKTLIVAVLSGLMVNALFLHIFGDNPAATVLLFVLVAGLSSAPLLQRASS